MYTAEVSLTRLHLFLQAGLVASFTHLWTVRHSCHSGKDLNKQSMVRPPIPRSTCLERCRSCRRQPLGAPCSGRRRSCQVHPGDQKAKEWGDVHPIPRRLGNPLQRKPSFSDCFARFGSCAISKWGLKRGGADTSTQMPSKTCCHTHTHTRSPLCPTVRSIRSCCVHCECPAEHGVFSIRPSQTAGHLISNPHEFLN